ncbi:MAG: zinc dependent phospholipase C family protein [Clostridiales bacterium]|nr:zinc dependent phospholipase C family protein [Clostridiales bacterium]
MPAFNAHYIFANEIMNDFKMISDFKVNENAVYIGTQGPDIFFFHRALPWMKGKSLRAAGSEFHRAKFGTALDLFREYCKISDYPEIAKSYVCGFIMHYALDRNCHPFIYYIQNEITKRGTKINPHTAHNKIESEIDSYLILKKFGGKIKPSEFSASASFDCNETVKKEIAKTLSFTAGKLISFKPTEKDIITAVEDTKYIQKNLTDKCGEKEKIIRILETAASPFTKNYKISAFFKSDDLEKASKYVNIKNENWISPFAAGKRNESFIDLFDYSKSDAINMIKEFSGGKPGEEITQNLSFLTGVKE